MTTNNKSRMNSLFKDKKGDVFIVAEIWIYIILILLILLVFAIFFISGYVFQDKFDANSQSKINTKLGASKLAVLLRTYLDTSMNQELINYVPFSQSDLTTEQISSLSKIKKVDKTYLEEIKRILTKDNDCSTWLKDKGNSYGAIFSIKTDKDIKQKILPEYFELLTSDNLKDAPSEECKSFLVSTILFWRSNCVDDQFNLKINTKEKEIIFGYDSKFYYEKFEMNFDMQGQNQILDKLSDLSFTKIILPLEDDSMSISMSCYLTKQDLFQKRLET